MGQKWPSSTLQGCMENNIRSWRVCPSCCWSGRSGWPWYLPAPLLLLCPPQAWHTLCSWYRDCSLHRPLGAVHRQTCSEAVYEVLVSSTSESCCHDYQALCHLLPSLFHLCLPSGVVWRSSTPELAGGVSKAFAMQLCHLMLSVAKAGRKAASIFSFVFPLLEKTLVNAVILAAFSDLNKMT